MVCFYGPLLDRIRTHPDTNVSDGAMADAIAKAESSPQSIFPPSDSELLSFYKGGALSCVEVHGVGRSGALDFPQESATLATYIAEIRSDSMVPFAHDFRVNHACLDRTDRGSSEESAIHLRNHEHAEKPDDPDLWKNCFPRSRICLGLSTNARQQP